MKKILCLIALACSPAFAFAQTCTPDLSITEPGMYPDTDTDLPQAYVGVPYSTSVQFKVLTDTTISGTHVTITDITLDSVSGMPPGFSFSSNPVNGVFPGGSNACASLYGSPQSGQEGNYNLKVHVMVHGIAFGFIPVSQPQTVNGYRIIINSSPVAYFSGDATVICEGNAVVFDDNSSGHPTSWAWSFPGGNPSSSTLQIPPPIVYAAPGSKNVTLTVSSPAGTHTKTKNAYITVNSSPSAAISANGPVTFCRGQDVTLSANTGSGLTYQWSSVYVPIPGATNDSYVAHYRGWFRAVVTDNNGCSATSNMIHVYVNTIPSPVVNASGPLTFCDGGSVNLSSANTDAGATYQWAKHNVNIPGQTNKSYNAIKSGTYRVIVSNASGCTRSSYQTIVSVNSLPVASVSANGPLTFCQGQSVNLTASFGIGYTYQWTKHDVNIPGQTGISYLAKKTGNYKVVVTDLNGCTKKSAPKNVLVNCREETGIAVDETAAIYPNPASSLTTIELNLSNKVNVSIQVFDLTGKLKDDVAEGNFEEGKHKFSYEASHLESGFYLVMIKAGDELKTIKLAVNKN